MERPMINADRFKQSKNAARAFESTLMVLEMLGLNENYIITFSSSFRCNNIFRTVRAQAGRSLRWTGSHQA